MPFIPATQAPVFRQIAGVVFTGLAAPSRGARENAVWTVELAPGTLPTVHRVSREEVIVGIAGEALALLDGVAHVLTPGSAVVVPADTDFSLANPGPLPFKGVAVLPVGGQAMLPGRPAFTPPWAA